MSKPDKLIKLRDMVEKQFKLKQPLFKFDVDSINDKNTVDAVRNLEAESIFIFAGWTICDSYVQLMLDMAEAFTDIPTNPTDRWGKWDVVKKQIKSQPQFHSKMKRVLEYASLLSSRS